MQDEQGFSVGKGHHHGDVSLKDLFDELVFGRVHQLDDVTVETVSVLLQKTCYDKKQSHVKQAPVCD